MDEKTTLAPRLSVEELVKTYERAERDIREGFALVSRAVESLNESYTMGGTFGVGLQDHSSYVSFSDPERHLTILRRALWGLLVERLDLRRVMSIKAWDELQDQLRKGEDVPEITRETVMGLVEGFRSQIPAMLEAAVNEVFDWLRPPRSEYKRNSELEVPRRIVISYAVERWSNVWSSWRLNYSHAEERFAALERVFMALDGKGQVGDTRHGYSQIHTLVHACDRNEKCEGETEYFRFKAFRNGNLHLTFLREDLLARFNQIAGGARLRPGKAA
jgi:hypothetical protein